MALINCTSHDIVLRDPDGTDHTFPPSGHDARMSSEAGRSPLVSHLAGVPVVHTVHGEVVGLPEPNGEDCFITSTMVAQRVGRLDTVSPDTGPTAIRVAGQVVAVIRFQSFV
jgi:hypothetical protein